MSEMPCRNQKQFTNEVPATFPVQMYSPRFMVQTGGNNNLVVFCFFGKIVTTSYFLYC
jgi:hypothetical protein